MEKENSVAADSETPTSNLSIETSVGSLSLSVENLSLSNVRFRGPFSFGSIDSLGFGGGSSASRTQETSPDIRETRSENSDRPVPTPLYPYSIWALNTATNNGGNHLGYDFQLGASCYMPAFYGEDVKNNQPNGFQERKETCRVVCQDKTPGMQNQESFMQGNRLIMFAKTQESSEALQDLLALRKSDITNQVLRAVTSLENEIPVICYLMVDQHGCYVCLQLIDSCNDQQLALLIENITRYPELFIKISCNIHGSKMIKKLIKKLKQSSLILQLVRALYTVFYQLMVHQIGSYVVIFCLDCLEVVQNQLLYEAVISHCLLLATDAIGCIAVNNFIDRIQGFHRQILLELISNNVVFLSQDPSGNHVVQKVLGLENPIFSARMGALLQGHFARLSMQKWGSHVVEKCLVSQAIIYAVEDLVTCSSTQLLQIARDQFGNYVIQRALKATKKWNNALHLRLLNMLEPSLNALQSGYGKNVYSLIVNGVPLN